MRPGRESVVDRRWHYCIVEFSEIAAVGIGEPTPAHLEPFVIAYLERHGPTKRVDLARAVDAEWLRVAGRPVASDVTVKLKKALRHMEQRGAVQQSGLPGIWQLVDGDSPDDPSNRAVTPSTDAAEPPEEEIQPDAAVEIGTGQQLVYCFYLPVYREQAEARGEARWPIKIGRTTGSLKSRLRRGR